MEYSIPCCDLRANTFQSGDSFLKIDAICDTLPTHESMEDRPGVELADHWSRFPTFDLVFDKYRGCGL